MWPRATWVSCTSNKRSWNTDMFSHQDLKIGPKMRELWPWKSKFPEPCIKVTSHKEDIRHHTWTWLDPTWTGLDLTLDIYGLRMTQVPTVPLTIIQTLKSLIWWCSPWTCWTISSSPSCCPAGFFSCWASTYEGVILAFKHHSHSVVLNRFCLSDLE